MNEVAGIFGGVMSMDNDLDGDVGVAERRELPRRIANIR